MRTPKLIALAATAILAACANQKEPAEQAVSKIEASLEGVSDEARTRFYSTNFADLFPALALS